MSRYFCCKFRAVSLICLCAVLLAFWASMGLDPARAAVLPVNPTPTPTPALVPGMNPVGQSNDMYLVFVPNRGQLEGRIFFSIQVGAHKMLFTRQGITYRLAGLDGEHTTIKLEYQGQNTRVRPMGVQMAPITVSIYVGRLERWMPYVPTFARILYPNLWDGIDLFFSGENNRLNYRYVIAPYADPDDIVLAYRSVSGLEVTSDGQLAVQVPVGGLLQRPPLAWQEIGGFRFPVTVSYKVGTHSGDLWYFYFDLGAYNPAYSLYITSS